MQFLCEHHRNRLGSLPLEAEECWERWMKSGAQAMSEGEWQKALRFVGSAFEASEMLLNQPDLSLQEGELSYADRYMISGHYLAECLNRLGSEDGERHYLLKVHSQLMAVAGDEREQSYRRLSIRKNLKISIALLKRHFDRAGEVEPLKMLVDKVESLTQSLRTFAVH